MLTNRGISVIRIHGPGVGYKPGIIAQIGHLLSGVGINIYSILTSQTCINLLVDKKDARSSYEAIKEMKGGVIDEINLEKDVTLIAVVGEGLLCPARRVWHRSAGMSAEEFSAYYSDSFSPLGCVSNEAIPLTWIIH
jgi:aspartokinase